MELVCYHLETLWAQNPRAVFKFMEALQAHAYREQADLGTDVRVLMFLFATRALGSCKKSIRHTFAKSMIHWLKNGDRQDVARAFYSLSYCHRRLGRFDEECAEALMAAQASRTKRGQEALDIFRPGR
jgi:hypothetical protein